MSDCHVARLMMGIDESPPPMAMLPKVVARRCYQAQTSMNLLARRPPCASEVAPDLRVSEPAGEPS